MHPEIKQDNPGKCPKRDEAHHDHASSDQGVQFTSREYLNIWDSETTKISMDGRGRAMDNIFTSVSGDQ